MPRSIVRRLFVTLVALLVPLATPAASRADLDASSKRVLEKLLADVPAAKALHARAVGVLVFPSITKAGFMIGGQYGEGVLWQNGKPTAYYNTAGASYGLQAGAQQYGYAMFLMNEKAVAALDANDGFEVGVGPSVVVVDQGMAKSVTTTTTRDDIYAFIFGQKGLMGGLGVQGNKITRLKD